MDEFIDNILNQLCAEELKCVKNIFVENDANYLQRIKEIDPLQQATNTNLVQGIAITIHDKNKDSDIVIREELLQTLKESYSIVDDKLKVNKNFLPSFRIILHEVGHAKDFKEREIENIFFEESKGFHFKDYISVYAYKFKSEYFAEKFAVTKILNLINTYNPENYYCEKEQIKLESKRIKNEYYTNRDLRVLSNNVIEFGWQYFLYPMSRKLGAESAQSDILSKKSDFLTTNNKLIEAIMEYGHSNLTNLLFDTFKSKMYEFGFRIECNDEGDAIFIN
ncbi:hypothetical protein [uncultured Draconibacterium sp.]|uniref:hypothetical protein n=1 Tax=uncultured Draconibacterium sp. TaxID=1573823 RepID=UPI0029C8167B|nr:hypothetical protein [uncultured Draconibacterium sp.]